MKDIDRRGTGLGHYGGRRDSNANDSHEFYSNDLDDNKTNLNSLQPLGSILNPTSQPNQYDGGLKKIFADSENIEADEIRALASGMTLADIREG